MIADIIRGGNQTILQDPQQLLKKILTSSRGGVFILDAATVEILECNPAASEIFGYSRDEMLGQTTTFLHVDESSLEEFRTQLYTAMKVEGFLNLPEFRMKRKNGEIFFTDHTVMPLEDDEGILIGWVSVVRDITKHKQTMEALRDSEKRFRQLAENIEVVFWMESPDGAQIHYVSPAFEKIWGSSIGDLKRDRNLWVKAIHPDDSPRVLSWVEGHKRGEAFHVEEFRIIRPDGEIRWVSDRAFPVRNEKGEIYRVAGFAEDITERKRMEEELRISRDKLEMRVHERTKELEAVNETLRAENEERLRAEIELRESENHLRELSMALLSAQERERKLIAGEIHDSLGASLAAAKFKAESVLNEMGDSNPQTRLAFESVIPLIQETMDEARRIQMSLRPSMLDDLGILAAVNWLCRQFESTYSNIRIKKEIDIQEHEVPESMKIVIYRILQEALNNIAKHSKASVALLSLRKAEQAMQLVIRDGGQGFDPEEAYSRRGATKGLGLDSMRERAELSGGSFSIESSKGAGTVIRATWPLNS
jgi:PAS domain S-box-containing protein